MTTTTKAATARRVLAIDLRKYKTVACHYPAATSSMHCGPWLRGLLAQAEMAYAAKSSPWYGTSSGSCTTGSSHRSKRFASRITNPVRWKVRGLTSVATFLVGAASSSAGSSDNTVSPDNHQLN